MIKIINNHVPLSVEMLEEAAVSVLILKGTTPIVATTTAATATIDGYTLSNNGMIKTISPRSSDSVVDSEDYTIELIEYSEGFLSTVDTQLIGAKIIVKVDFKVNSIPGSITMFSGLVKAVALKKDTAEHGSSIYQITGGAPLANFNMKKGILLNKDNIRLRDPDDSSCDEIFTGSAGATIKWGKE